MDIYISDKAKEYIKKKSNSIQIKPVQVGGGWCARYEPSVKVGRPSNESGFRIYNVGDIDVYFAQNLITRNDELKIDLSKVLWIKSLTVDGISI